MKTIALLSSFILVTMANVHGAEKNPFPDLPPTEPPDAVATFDLHQGFEIELVASEPLIADPVAMSFDEDSGLYVVEMRGYSERRDDKLGRIKRLEDRNHDGQMDHATTFVEGLSWPTGVLSYDGGVFVLAAPDLWYFKDTDDDGVADQTRLILTGFSEQATRLNIQQLPNNIRWGIDQKIHIAEGGNGSLIRKPDDDSGDSLHLRGRDLVIDPKTLEFHAENGGGQFGMTFDNAGRKFVSSNSDHLQAVLYGNIVTAPAPGGRASINDTTTLLPPKPKRSISADGGAAPVYRLSPDEAWRVVRTRWRVSGHVGGPIEGGGRPSGYFTGATGLQIYRGDLFPNTFDGDVFVADVGSNLIHRKKLHRSGETFVGKRASDEQSREFLASTDNWFRPVQLENGPDGALYILDFYRELIEHPWSLPPGIKEHLDLNRGNQRGRIWRVIPKGSEPRRNVALGSSSNAELIELLAHRNGWHRDTASRLLSERNDPTSVELLVNALTKRPSHLARLHSLTLLNQFNALEIEQLRSALADADPNVREVAIRIAGERLTRKELLNPDWNEVWSRLARDDNPIVRWQLLITLAGHPSQKLFELLLENSTDLSNPTRALNYFASGLTPEFHPNNFAENRYRNHLDVMTKLVRRSAVSAEASRIQNWVDSIAIDSTSEDLNYKLLTIVSGLAPSPAMNSDWTMPAPLETEFKRQIKLALTNETTASIAFSVMTSSPSVETDSLLIDMLPYRSPPGTWSGVVAALTTRSTRENFERLIAKLPSLPPDRQVSFLRAAMKKQPQRAWFQAQVESDPDFESLVGPVFRNQLREHPEEGVRTWALNQFGSSESDSTVAERISKYEPAVQIRGNAESGKSIYQSRCAVCHRAGNNGPEIGPDLVTVSRAGRPTLLRHILDPNREINATYESWEIRLNDGTELTGKRGMQNGTRFSLTLADGSIQQIDQVDTTRIRPSGQSMMPEGLEAGLSVEDMADLLRFIEDLAIPDVQTFAE